MTYIDPVARAHEICLQAPAFEFITDDELRNEAIEFNQWLFREIKAQVAAGEAFWERMQALVAKGDNIITHAEREEMFGLQTWGSKLTEAAEVMFGWTLSATIENDKE